MRLFLLSAALGFLASIIPEAVIAGSLPDMGLSCGDIPGCGMANKNVLVDSILPIVAREFLNATAILSVFFVLVGGGRLLISFGRDEEITKARMTIIWSLIGLLVALSAHRIVIAVLSQDLNFTNTKLANNVITHTLSATVKGLTVILNATFFIAIFIGAYRMVTARGKDDEVNKGRNAIIYAIIGAVLINIAPFVVKQFIRIMPS